MTKPKKITCEQELAKIKLKAEKRHQYYMKNKKPNEPLKKDVIIALQAEVEQLKRIIKEGVPEIVEPEPQILEAITPLLDEIITKIEEENEPNLLDEITPILDEIITKIEGNHNPKVMNPLILSERLKIEAEAEAEEKEEDEIYDKIYINKDDKFMIENPLKDEKYNIYMKQDDNFMIENPLKASSKVCQYKKSIYTLDFMIEQIDELSWKTDAIRETIRFSVNIMFPLMENPHLPTCIVCLDKLVENLDSVETDNQKKKIFFQCLMVLIRRVEVKLKQSVIEKYKQIYTNYRYSRD